MSKYLTVSVRQWIKGLLLAIIGAVIGVVYSALKNHGQVDLKVVGLAALNGALPYILHALGTDTGVASPTQGKFLGKI